MLGRLVMKVIFINRQNLTAFFLILSGLFFIILNMIFSRQQLLQASSQYKTDIPIYSVETDEKKCAITFDCAWGADDIPHILEILDQYEAKATFFIVGLWAEKYPDMVKLMDQKGHEVANHGYAHLHMASIPEEKMVEDIERCSETLNKITGGSVRLFRPPYGEYNALLVRASKKLGYPMIQWDCDSLDWKKTMTKENIYDRVIKKTSNGSIILFHNDTQFTEDVLPDILKTLKDTGYTCVTVSDMLLKEPYKIRYDGRQMKE